MKKLVIFYMFYLISMQNVFSMSCQQLCKIGDYSACQKMVMRMSCEEKVNTSSTTSKISKKYKRECDADNAKSCLQLGMLFEKGKEVRQDKVKAGKLYTKACNLNNASACAVLGTFYAEDIGNNGKNPDFNKAFIYIEKACKKGSYPACVNLGMMYLKGQGVKKSLSTSLSIFKKTCNKGFQVACENYQYLEKNKASFNKQPIVKINKPSIKTLASKVRVIDSVNTVAGTFKLIEDNDNFVKSIQLNDKVVMKIEDSFIGIEKIFKIENHSVVIVWSNYSPNGNPSYRIFDIDTTGKVTQTKSIGTSDYTFNAYKKGSDTIEIDLGFEEGKKKFFIYSNGKLYKKRKKSLSKSISTEDCKWLYSDIYNQYLRKARPCTERIGYAVGNSLYHGYYSLTQNPNFNKSFFREMLTENCSSGMPLAYQDFSHAICQGNSNKESKLYTSAHSKCSMYHVVTVKQLNIRNSPKKPSKVVGKVNRGQEVCIYEFSGKWGRSDRGWISGKYLVRSQEGISIPPSSKKLKIDSYMISSILLPTQMNKVYNKLGKSYTVLLPNPNEEGAIGQIHKWQYRGGILSVVGDSYSSFKIDTTSNVRLVFLQGLRYSKVSTIYGTVINNDDINIVKQKLFSYISVIGAMNYILESFKQKTSFYGESYDHIIRFKDPKTKLYNLFYFENNLLKKVIQGTFDFTIAG